MSVYDIFPVKEVSGDIVTFEDGADGIPLESLSAVITPTQDLHGYDHPWPAGGGKNKFYYPTNFNATGSYGLVYKYDKDTETFSITGTNTKTSEYIALFLKASDGIATPSLTVGQTCYVYHNLPTGTYLNLTYFDGNGVNKGFSIIGGAAGTGDYVQRSFIVPNDYAWFSQVQIGVYGSATQINKTDIHIALGTDSAFTEWTPYSNICPISGRTGLSVYVSPTQDPDDATTYAVDWTTEAGTLYGGTLDVVTGELTVDRAYALLNDPSQWAAGSGTVDFIYNTSYSDRKKYDNSYDGIICSYMVVSSAGQNTITARWTGATSNFFGLRWVGGTLDQVKADAQENKIAIVYELATPLTYQLTPQEIATLLGLNNVWATVAPITVKYHAQAQTENVRIDKLFVNGEDMQESGWSLKWRKLAAPKPKTDYVSVWGRDGDIDLTESETDGQVFYENRELTMDMVYIGDNWTQAYSELLDKLHGKDCMVQFTSDPYWYWAGRVVASLFEHKPHSLTMNGIMFPYKLSVSKNMASATVSGATEETATEVVLHGSRMRVSPKVTVTGESITMKWGDKTQTLSAGTYYVRGLKVGSDDVTIKVWGTGTVNFEYRKGML